MATWPSGLRRRLKVEQHPSLSSSQNSWAGIIGAKRDHCRASAKRRPFEASSWRLSTYLRIEETTPQSWAVVGATPTQHSLDAQGVAGSSRLVQTVPVGKEGFLFGRPVQSAPVEESSSAGRYSLYRPPVESVPACRGGMLLRGPLQSVPLLCRPAPSVPASRGGILLGPLVGFVPAGQGGMPLGGPVQSVVVYGGGFLLGQAATPFSMRLWCTIGTSNRLDVRLGLRRQPPRIEGS
ncbi:hypothetical protein PCASD_00877 [Puccinia coronata f. sp. avenae]|uniref:Uncharacterized protein n=1 Tax=Puccinia coronata f. sp. avenae TaxID=200324 RepID=A0A2N5VPN4_9BASI|nr:hypothetical protein PCASD_00877 [Puccinia coronata f. sp. avenae]